MENEFLIELQAKLDEAKSKKHINEDIVKIQKQIDELKIKAEIDPKTITSLTKQLEGILNQKITLSNIGVDKNQVRKSGQQIGQIISDSAEKAIGYVTSKNIGKYFKVSSSDSKQFQVEMEKLVSGWTNGKGKVTDINIQTRTSYDQEAKENIERLHQATVAYKNELDEVIKKTIAWRQIGTTTNDKGEEVPLRGFVEVAGQYSKSIEAANAKTDNFIEKQKNAVAAAQNTLTTIESKLHDVGANKTLANTDFNANGLNNQINTVKNAIELLGNANRDTFSQAQRDVNREINSLENLISTLKNAEYAATSLRTKDIATIKIDEGNKLDTFVQKMEQSGHYTDELKGKVSQLKSDLSNVFDVDTLTKYLNSVGNLQTEFQKVDVTAKTAEKSIKLKANIEAEKKILQVYTNELREAGILTGDVKLKIQEMFHSLSKVDTQSSLITWRAELKGVKAETDAVLKSTIQEKSEEEKLANAIASVREKAEQARQAEEKRQQLAQSKEINKSLEEEYLQRQKLAEQVNKNQFSIDTEEYSTDIVKLKNQLNKYGDLSGEAFDKARTSFKYLLDTYKEMLSAMADKKLDDSSKIKSEEEYQKALLKTKNLLAQLNSEKDNEILNTDDTRRVNMISTLNKYLATNTAMNKQNKQTIQEWIATLASADDVTGKTLKNIKNEFKVLDTTLRESGQLGLSFPDKMKQTWEKFGGWSLATGVLSTGVYKFKSAVSELKEIDSILTEISKTSDLTTAQLEKLGNSAFDSASKYGKTAEDYLTGVQEMYRAGFNNAEQMSELSILAQSAGDLSSDSANDYLIATNAAYDLKGNIEALNGVLDSQNYITNNAAVSMQDMADATSEAASIASQYGINIDELSALIAVATSKTRESGSEVGTALKALFVNLQDTTSKPIREAFEAVNISMTEIVDGTERLKTPIELLKELSSAFNSLEEGDVRRANILNDIGGKHHANTLSAILSDLDSYNSMLDLYTKGAGSAAEEAEKSANNITGSLNKLGNSWTELVNTIVDTDNLISGINVLNNLVDIVQKLTENFGLLPVAAVAAYTAISAKNSGGLIRLSHNPIINKKSPFLATVEFNSDVYDSYF